MMKAPKINDNSQDEGKVVVSITVDRYGKVMNALLELVVQQQLVPLYRLAKEAAFNTRIMLT